MSEAKKIKILLIRLRIQNQNSLQFLTIHYSVDSPSCFWSDNNYITCIPYENKPSGWTLSVCKVYLWRKVYLYCIYLVNTLISK